MVVLHFLAPSTITFSFLEEKIFNDFSLKVHANKNFLILRIFLLGAIEFFE